jgi:amidase
MGSLRNPAGWNNIIGLRPSQGRVPMQPSTEVWINQLATEGPMGRTVEDVARLLAIQSGYDAKSPLSLQQTFDLEAALKPMTDAETNHIRIGWLGDLNGYLPCEAGVLDLCSNALQAMQHKGYKVDSLTSQTQLGFEPIRVWDAWLVWRAMLVASRLSGLLTLPNARAQMKPEALWEIDSAKNVTGVQFNQAAAVRSSFYAAMLKLFEPYDVLALPSAQVFPFDVTMRYPTEIITARGAVQMDTYHRWMESSIYATFAGLPAISVPAGFGTNGLPMGLQLIGKPQGDADLLRLVALFD